MSHVAPITGNKSRTDLEKDPSSFNSLAQILKRTSGIHLPHNSKNISLMSGRLWKILARHNISSYRDYLKIINSDKSGNAVDEFISAMTTNTTHFFRESGHFDVLKNKLPELVEQIRQSGRDEIKLWCSAASKGHEPYSILMTLLESGAIPESLRIRLLATDIDMNVLNWAARGIYPSEELDQVSRAIKLKYFDKRQNEDRLWYRVKPELARRVTFAQLNLIKTPYPFQQHFDIIFCRNVLIYFAEEETKLVVKEMSKYLTEGGLMFVGHSESGCVRQEDLSPFSHAAYRKVE